MRFFRSYERILLEGVFPERAILRLQREKIPLYDIKKVQKTQILFTISKKDSEKVFAIYPNVCYNNTVYSPFYVKKAGERGVARMIAAAKARIGMLVGALLCAITLFAADSFVFGVEFVGSSVYRREALSALEQSGILPFSTYKKGREDEICAQLLTLPSVEYCSVKKSGGFVYVEMRLSPFGTDRMQKESLRASRSGEILSMAVLRGTERVRIGQFVHSGDLLVENVLETEEGRQVCVEPIAKVVLACTYEADIAAETQEEAFAKAYLEIGFFDTERLIERSIEARDGEQGLFHVKIRYTTIERVNM